MLSSDMTTILLIEPSLPVWMRSAILSPLSSLKKLWKVIRKETFLRDLHSLMDFQNDRILQNYLTTSPCIAATDHRESQYQRIHIDSLRCLWCRPRTNKYFIEEIMISILNHTSDLFVTECSDVCTQYSAEWFIHQRSTIVYELIKPICFCQMEKTL